MTIFNVFLAVFLIAAIVRNMLTNRASRKLNRRSLAAVEEAEANNREAAAINNRSAVAAKEAETINRRSTQLLNQADAAWSNSLGWDVGPDDCDQDAEPRSTRNLVDPWAEIHHPERHQAAAIQPAGLPTNLYQCQCGRQHQRPAPLPESERTAGDVEFHESLGIVRGSN